MFDAFIGIDWSGAKGSHQKGLKVALARPGRGAPVLVPGPGGRGAWSRAAVAEWLSGQFAQHRCLAGLDFAFGMPVCDGSDGAKLDWEYVERLCCGDDNFYGGRFFRAEGAPHSPYINSPWVKGSAYSAKRLRATELAAAKVRGATPQSVFNAVGAAQVGPSSLSGMRFLRHMRERFPDAMTIWPFEPVDERRSAMVEIFPRYFPLSVGLSPNLKDRAHLDAALSAFESEPTGRDPQSEDEGDALISAAALRHLSMAPGAFSRPSASLLSEGWIFGVSIH